MEKTMQIPPVNYPGPHSEYDQAEEEAHAEAVEADADRAAGRPLGPSHGVPITINEQFLLVGTATTFGFKWRKNHRADHTGPLVTALRAAGAIILGKTNLSQNMAYIEADNLPGSSLRSNLMSAFSRLVLCAP